MITAERLRDLLSYSPETGFFIYRTTRGNKIAGSLAGSLCDGHIHIKIDNVIYKAHRLAWLYMNGQWPAGEVDHENLFGSDNRWHNLRDATKSQNQANRGRNSNNRSGFKGVCFHKATGKWSAELTCGGRRMYLGLFATAREAHRAYLAKAKEAFSGFARAA